MKALLFATCLALSSVNSVNVHAAETLILKNLRANVEIIPEDRTDISVSVEANGSSDSPPSITKVGNSLTVEGNIQTGQRPYRVSFNLDHRMIIEEVKRRSHLRRIHPSGLFLIVIHTPLSVKLKSNAYIFGHIAKSQSVDISDNGDGEWNVDPVSQDISVGGGGGTDFYLSTSRSAAIELLGTGNVTLGDTNSLYSIQYGSGDLIADKINHDADITISGIGDFIANYISGPMHTLITDAGNVRIKDGDVTKLTVRTIDGIGAVQFGGTVKDVDVNIGTSTKVLIHKVTGNIRKTTRQSATLEIENQ